MTAAARSFQLWPPLTVSPGRPPPAALRRRPSVGCPPPAALRRLPYVVCQLPSVKGPSPHQRDGNPRPPGAKCLPHTRETETRGRRVQKGRPHTREKGIRGRQVQIGLPHTRVTETRGRRVQKGRPHTRETETRGRRVQNGLPHTRETEIRGRRVQNDRPRTRETAKPEVSSLPRHRDLSKADESSSLVPPPTPRPLKIRRIKQSRPSSGTETYQNPPKPAVSSLPQHRDLSKSDETRSLVPPPTPRPLRRGLFPPRGGGKSQSPCAKEAVSPTGGGVSHLPPAHLRSALHRGGPGL